jgi:hypothetical protein
MNYTLSIPDNEMVIEGVVVFVTMGVDEDGENTRKKLRVLPMEEQNQWDTLGLLRSGVLYAEHQLTQNFREMDE